MNTLRRHRKPRFGLATKFNVVFLIILFITGINIVSVRMMLTEASGVAETINIAGKLRMLSQKMAFNTTLAIHDPSQSVHRQTTLQTIRDYETALSALQHGGEAFGLQVPAITADMQDATSSLRTHWLDYRTLLLRLLDTPGSAVELDTLQLQAAELLEQAEALVARLTTATRLAQQRTLNRLYLAIVVEIAIIGVLVWLVRQRLVAPLLALAHAARALSDQRYDQRVQFRSHDEIGELVDTFNTATGRIGQLVHQIEHLANHDALTGLGNRNLLQDHLQLAVASAKRANTSFAVLMLDLNDFKVINDSLGHSIGDQLLEQVAQRLQQSIRDGDTIARFGGDEFVIVLPSASLPGDASSVAEKIHSLLTMPFVVNEQEMFVHASIGITLYPQDGDAEALIRNADLAMYRVKREQRIGYRFYSEELNQRNLQRLELERDLHHAIGNGALYLDYQPKVCLTNGNICGAEALLRWQHPTLGRISPLEFIPLAEQNGMIIPIGEWVIETACTQLRQWLDAGLAIGHVAVNVSGKQLRSTALHDHIVDALQRYDLQAQHLQIELTESVLMDQHDEVMTTIHQLREAGIQFAMDDFGTGYSSLNYLKRFPFDHLKLDKTFIEGVNVSRRDTAIVQSVLAIGRAFDLNTIAEGVETQAQLQFLLAHHCDEAQGYLFSPPLSADALAQLLASKGTFLLPD